MLRMDIAIGLVVLSCITLLVLAWYFYRQQRAILDSAPRFTGASVTNGSLFKAGEKVFIDDYAYKITAVLGDILLLEKVDDK